MPITLPGLQEPGEPRILEGAAGTLCARCRPIMALGHPWPRALVPLGNAIYGTFPAFPAFPGFFGNSGGPSLPSGQNWLGTSKVARMATLRLFGPDGTPGNPGQPGWPGWSQTPTPGRLNWPEQPACWLGWIPGGHTARFQESDGSHLS